MTPLPIDEVMAELLEALAREPCIVLRAPTGAGKTTRVPPAIWAAGLAGSGQILVIEPRRLAASAAARRMASERRLTLGEEFGYQVRFDRRASARTRVLVMTPGLLLRRLQDDSFIEDVSCIVFDEFHERSLDSDLCLGIARLLQKTVRPELRLLVMSATLEAQSIAAQLGGCPIIESQGRSFPVTIHYRPRDQHKALEESVLAALKTLSSESGSSLVFLPGLHEIRRTQSLLLDHGYPRESIVELYGDLPLEAQDSALRGGGQRRIILATNVAESSVTVDGVTSVIDSGLARQSRYDPRLGLDRLDILPIARDSADQRAGRAGRTAPGQALRLWSEIDQSSRPARSEPEVLRIDLSGAVLQLCAYGEAELESFPWFEKPRAESLDQAKNLLRGLGAIDSKMRITALGKRLAQVPSSPRLARLLLAGTELGAPKRSAMAAALLSERSPFLRKDGPEPTRLDESPSDVLDRIEALEAFEKNRSTESIVGSLKASSARSLLKVRDQFLRLLDKAPANRASDESEEALARALLAAFPDRLARRREARGRKAIMLGGKGLELARSSAVLGAELFLAIEVDAGRGDALVRQASAVEREWLDPSLIQSTIELDFDAEQERFSARRRSRYLDLILDESPAALPNDFSEALLKAARENLERVLPQPDSEFSQLRARIDFLRTHLPERTWPKVDAESCRELLEFLVPGRRSFEQLRAAPWLEVFKGTIDFSIEQAIDSFAPATIKLPTGRQASLIYENGKAPVLAARIQELFGLHDTPRLAAGRIPLTVHLLAPNYRPQQITDDLRSFWTNTYQQVRKDLRGRYPKHAWPEDPWTAVAEDRPRRKSS